MSAKSRRLKRLEQAAETKRQTSVGRRQITADEWQALSGVTADEWQALPDDEKYRRLRESGFIPDLPDLDSDEWHALPDLEKCHRLREAIHALNRD